MRIALLLLLTLTGCTTPLSQRPTTADRVAQWSAHVATLSSDAMEGRGAGTPGHERAVRYVEGELRRLGLQPAGLTGFRQPIAFTGSRIDYAASSAKLTIGGTVTPVPLPSMAVISLRRPLVPQIDAPLIFVGYGLHMPTAGHDDFAGVDLRGKIAVFVSGGPATAAGPTKAHARARRARLLAERGAAGSISISTPTQLESPWKSTVRSADRPGMYFADPSLRPEAAPFLEMSWDPAAAQQLFGGTNQTFAAIAAAADASKPLPGFDMKGRLSGRFTGTTRPVSSANIVARLPGSDRALASEHLILSAHLDGVSTGPAINGDTINNGTLDNAAGVAALFDIATALQRDRPRRSILFVFVTAEERGLLGSRYFSRRPTVARDSIVANLNYDMALPLHPLRGVTVLGAEESTIGTVAEQIGRSMRLPLVPDAFPDRNAFIRSDQYAFIEQGIPSVAFKFGLFANTPDAATEAAFRSTRYHQRTDDLTTPIFPQDEIRLHDFIAALALRIASDPKRPQWNQGSIFAR